MLFASTYMYIYTYVYNIIHTVISVHCTHTHTIIQWSFHIVIYALYFYNNNIRVVMYNFFLLLTPLPLLYRLLDATTGSFQQMLTFYIFIYINICVCRRMVISMWRKVQRGGGIDFSHSNTLSHTHTLPIHGALWNTMGARSVDRCASRRRDILLSKFMRIRCGGTHALS